MDTEPDRDLLFAVVSLEDGRIDAQQLAAACADRATHRSASLREALAGRGWIGPGDRDRIDRLVAERLRGRNGGPGATVDLAVTERMPATVESADGTMDAGLPASPSSTEGLGLGLGSAYPTEVADDTVHTIDFSAEPPSVVVAHPSPRRIASLGAAPGQSRDRYTLGPLHAQGGIGQVWRAIDPEIGRVVALKELRPDRGAGPSTTARFLAEARITGQLEHPGIVPVYELAGRSSDGAPYYTMRFIRGRTLAEAIKEDHNRRRAGEAGPLDRAALLDAFVAACHAVAYAHARGVIHRDLKGQNVVLGDFGEVIVLDWGLAKVIGEPEPGRDLEPVTPPEGESLDATVAGRAIGTPAYMAPEQAEGRLEQIGRRTDVYGLGAILYEILAGQPPFGGATLSEILHHVVHDAPRPPRQAQPDTPRALEAICLKALAKDPAARYASAAELAADVRRWLADEPVTAFREPWPVRLGRWARRHRTTVAAAATLLATTTLALAAGTVAVSRERDEARHQRDEARRQRGFARRAVDDMYTDVAEKFLADRDDPLQRSYLEKALASYERFAAEDPGDASLARERGRAYFRIGEIQARLGRLAEAEAGYRRALALLRSPAAGPPSDPERRDDIAQAWSRLGVLLTRRDELKPAEEALTRAAAIESALAKEIKEPAYAVHLARTSKALADLLRLAGRPKEAEAASERALAILDRPSQAADDAGDDLAEASEGRGLLLAEHGDADRAEAAYRKALVLQERLALAGDAASARSRDGLARTSNSLGLLLFESGRPDEAEKALRRSYSLYDRLVAEFPGRPEYRRGQARAQLNLGLVQWSNRRSAPAEASYRKALELYEDLQGRVPGEPKYRRDLARACNNLAAVLAETGRVADAEPLARRALEVYDKLARDFPGVPEYRRSEAEARENLALMLQQLGNLADSGAEARRAAEAFAALDAGPDRRADDRRHQGRSLQLAGQALFYANPKSPEVEPTYRRALALFESAAAERPNALAPRRDLASCLNNLAELGPKDAESLYRRAREAYAALVERTPSTLAYRKELATLHNNYGEWLAKAGRRPEAEASLDRALALLDRLAQDDPDRAEYRFLLGYVHDQRGRLLLADGRPDDARAAFERAVYHQVEAVDLQPKDANYRRALQGHLRLLAQAHLALSDHAGAARVAAELLRTASARSTSTRVEVARILSRCLPLIDGDAGLPAADRAAEAKEAAERAVAALNQATEAGWKGAGKLEGDPDFAPLRARPEFRGVKADAPAP